MKLFEPITIRGITLKNRIVMSPMRGRIGDADPRARAFYVERARGGSGAILLGATFVDWLTVDRASGEPGGAAQYLEGLAETARAVKQAGAKVGMQLFKLNGYPDARYPEGDPDWVAPSLRVEPDPPIHPMTMTPRKAMREMTKDEIQDVIGRFACGARLAKEAGFDFVEFHATHGSLPCQFFSPLDNRRTDKYGGDLAGRMRFGLECIRSMRAAVGDAYPLWLRIGAKDDLAGGIRLGDSVKYAVELQRAGIDCLDVTVGVASRTHYMTRICPSRRSPMGTFAPLARAFKARLSIPVVAVGRINTPQVAEGILSQGWSDLVAIGRQLIADPFWPEKVRTGRASDIIECNSCRNCWARSRFSKLAPGLSLCAVNPQAGSEWEKAESQGT